MGLWTIASHTTKRGGCKQVMMKATHVKPIRGRLFLGKLTKVYTPENNEYFNLMANTPDPV